MPRTATSPLFRPVSRPLNHPILAVLACTLAWAAPSTQAQTSSYPSKPIRVIVPFAAGSTTDIIARAITDKMGQSMGQPLVVDNRGGASGTIGQQAVATAAPDGYTIMIHSSSHTVSPSTFAKLPFDTVQDFAGVTPISSLPNALVVSPAKGFKTLQDLLARARANPGTLNFASAGQGSATHLNAEKFKMAAKIDATNIPFKGSAEAVTEVLAGRVDYYFSPIAPVIGQIRDGQTEAFRAAVLAEILPKWQAFPGALSVRVTFAESRDEGAPEYPMILAINYPDLASVEAALAKSRTKPQDFLDVLARLLPIKENINA